MTSQSGAPRILDNIPFRPQQERILGALGIAEADAPMFLPDIEELLAQAEAVARPKGVYKLSTVDHPGGEKAGRSVIIDKREFTSRILAVNLKDVQRVFPYIASCGAELEAWSQTIEDPVKRFWADAIKEEALRCALEAVAHDVIKAFRPGERASMNPGSLEDWPLSEQPALFALFGEAVGTIGVGLSESLLMIPVKSVSGLWFEADSGFQSCQLCPRENCPKRRAPYDPHLFGARYAE
ncbi:MAG: vitamin B12 dependent methionine synthase [Candidatus Hydrogenedentes bacterium]|nr:vitamin B12 dependent methionine synthase [Candidatus Hydrogenedentota bacterium]